MPFKVRLIEHRDAFGFHQMVMNNRDKLEDYFPGTLSQNLNTEDSEIFVKSVLTKFEEKTYMPFVIEDTDSGKLIGYIDLKNIHWQTPKAEFGCFMDRDSEGQGIALKAMHEVIEILKKDHGFVKLVIRTHESNTAARRLAEKLGFEVEGKIRRDHRSSSGELMDLLYYGLIL